MRIQVGVGRRILGVLDVSDAGVLAVFPADADPDTQEGLRLIAEMAQGGPGELLALQGRRPGMGGGLWAKQLPEPQPSA